MKSILHISFLSNGQLGTVTQCCAGTGSVSGRYLVIMDQNRAALVASVICFQKIFGLYGLNHQIIEYWVSRGRYWLVLGGTGSVWSGIG